VFLFIVCIDSDCEVRIKKEMIMLTDENIALLCYDCVDRYRAERFDKLMAALKDILRDLEGADRPLEKANALGNLHLRLHNLVEQFALSVT